MTPVQSLFSADEAERLRSLHLLDIHRSLNDTIFDEYVRLAARVFNLPISLISLVDSDNVTYIANTGLPDLKNQPRVEAICAIAVQQGKAAVFADLSSMEQRLSTEALVAARAKNLQFYAGAPLQVPDERSIGTLCVIDHQPRTFSDQEAHLLAYLARIVARTIAVRHYCLMDGLGETHWQQLQEVLVEETGALTALVRYTVARVGNTVPVSELVLEQVTRRLQTLEQDLREYHLSKQ